MKELLKELTETFNTETRVIISSGRRGSPVCKRLYCNLTLELVFAYSRSNGRDKSLPASYRRVAFARIQEEYSVPRSSPKVTIIVNVISVIIMIIIVAIIMILIILEVAERPVGAPLFDIFSCTDCPSVTLHFPSYLMARAVLIHLDNDLL
jgi:hypothetical protein